VRDELREPTLPAVELWEATQPGKSNRLTLGVNPLAIPYETMTTAGSY
jgi:hypothetical protein